MKKTTIALMAACAILAGCHNHGSGSGHNHSEEIEEHQHEAGHGHEEGHGHDGEDHDHDHDHGGEAAGKGGHADEIVISVEKQKALGIEVDTVSSLPFSEIIHTSGQIISSTGDEMTVVARSSGIVNLGNLTEGSAVSKGGRIANVSSRSIGSGDLLAKARIAYETAKKEYDRDVQLLEDNIVSESHFDQSKLAYEQAKAEYDALVNGGATENGVTVTSPLSGFIKNLSVRNGDYVETGAPIATVSQNRRLRLRADVSEKYYNLIATVNDANFTTASSDRVYNLAGLGGKLLSYGRSSDGDFYIPVTFEFDNRGDILPGSYAEVYLKTSATKESISVPVSAIIEDQGVCYAFVQHESDAFKRVEVTLGQSDGERVLVRSGLSEGSAVVVRGALQVKLSSVAAVPAGHAHNH